MKLPNRCAAVSASRLLLVSLLSGLLMCLPAGAQESSVYKWVDKDGTPHFTDVPPATGESEQLAVSSRRTDRSAIQSQMADRAEASESAKKRAALEAEKTAAMNEKQAGFEKQRRANCDMARSTQQKYFGAHKLFSIDADGEREYLSAAEIDAAYVKAGKSVQEWCDE